MRQVPGLAVFCLFLWGFTFDLGAQEIVLFDTTLLRDTLAFGGDVFLPRFTASASEALLLGGGPGDHSAELAYFSYGRGTLVLEEDGRASEKTLIRFFLDSLGEKGSFAAIEIAPMGLEGEEMSRPFQGGTLYFSRLRAQEARLVTDRRKILALNRSPGIFTSHFDTGDHVFWLGDGSRYFCYDQNGHILSEYDLAEQSSLENGRALFAVVFSSGDLCLVLEGGGILFIRREYSERFTRYSMNLSDLFIQFYQSGLDYMERYRPELAEEYKSWSARSVYALFKKDPLNPLLSALNQGLN